MLQNFANVSALFFEYRNSASFWGKTRSFSTGLALQPEKTFEVLLCKSM